MTSEFEMSDQANARPTRRTVVAAGVKLAYVAPIVAASFKVSASNVFATAVSGGFCGHSTGTNGGCMPTCTAAFSNAGCGDDVTADEASKGPGGPGTQCGVICGTGQSAGACGTGQGGDNPCCNDGYCNPSNYKIEKADKVCIVSYVGPTTGCK